MCVRHNGRLIHVGMVDAPGIPTGFYWCAEMPGVSGSMSDMIGPYSDRDTAISEAKRICDEQFDLLCAEPVSYACQ